MADGAAAAVDKSKEVKDDKPQAHHEAAAGALDKLKADSQVVKPDAKPADSTVAKSADVAGDSKTVAGDAKKDGTDHGDEHTKSWTELALDEVRNTKLAAWLSSKSDAAPVAKAEDKDHLDIPALDFGSAAPLKFNQPVDQPADKPADKPAPSTWDTIWNVAEKGGSAVVDYLHQAADSAWSTVESSVTKLESLGSKFADNATTAGVAVEGAYSKISAQAADMFNDIKSDGKAVTKDGVTYHFAKDGDAAVENKNLSVVSEKNGDRIVTDKKTGDVFDYNKNTGEITKVEKNGEVTHYSKDEVTKQYGDWVGVVNNLTDDAARTGRKLAMGEVQTDPDGKLHYQGIDRKVTMSPADKTVTMEMTDKEGKPTGVSFVIDHKTHMVTIDDHGQKSTESTKDFFAHNKLAEGLKVHGSHIDMDGQHEGHDHKMHAQAVTIDAAAAAKDPALVVKSKENGETVAIRADGKGKFDELHADSAGQQIGNRTQVDAHNTAHAVEEINPQGVVVSNIDLSRGFEPSFFNNDGSALWNLTSSGDMCFGSPSDSDYFSLSSNDIFSDSQGEEVDYFTASDNSARAWYEQEATSERVAEKAEDESEAGQALAQATYVDSIYIDPNNVGSVEGEVEGALELATDALYDGASHNNTAVVAAASAAIAAIDDERSKLSATTTDSVQAA